MNFIKNKTDASIFGLLLGGVIMTVGIFLILIKL